MVEDIVAYRIPAADAATTVTLAGLPHQPRADHRIPASIQMWSENLVDKSLFSLAFNVDEHSGHSDSQLRVCRRVRFSPKVHQGYSFPATSPNSPTRAG